MRGFFRFHKVSPDHRASSHPSSISFPFYPQLYVTHPAYITHHTLSASIFLYSTFFFVDIFCCVFFPTKPSYLTGTLFCHIPSAQPIMTCTPSYIWCPGNWHSFFLPPSLLTPKTGLHFANTRLLRSLQNVTEDRIHPIWLALNNSSRDCFEEAPDCNGQPRPWLGTQDQDRDLGQTRPQKLPIATPTRPFCW